jgi:hypothetical protein
LGKWQKSRTSSRTIASNEKGTDEDDLDAGIASENPRAANEIRRT